MMKLHDFRTKYVYWILLILVFIGLGIWYRFFYLTSPARSIERIVTAVEKKDKATITALVDIPTIASTGYDGLAHHHFNKYNAHEFSTNPFLTFMNASLKNIYLPSINRTLISLLDTPTEEENRETVALTHQLWLFDPYFTFTTWQYKGVDSVETEQNTDRVTLLLHNTWLDCDVRLPLTMTRLDEYTWKVSDIADMELFLRDIDTGVKKKLAAINQPVQEEMNRLVTIDSVSLPSIDVDPKEDPKENTLSSKATAPVWKLLKIHAVLGLHTKDTPIAAIHVWYELRDKNNLLIFSGPFVIRDLPSDSTTFSTTNQFLLSPFFESHKTLMSIQDFSSYTSTLEIQRIERKDGQVLEKKVSIPVPKELQ